jgi:hypothetical protein
MSNGALPPSCHAFGKPTSNSTGATEASAPERHPRLSAATAAYRAPSPQAPFAARLLYWSCFYVSYRVVFSTFFFASFIPGSGPFTAGLADGAKAASDAVGHYRSKKTAQVQEASPNAVPPRPIHGGESVSPA